MCGMCGMCGMCKLEMSRETSVRFLGSVGEFFKKGNTRGHLKKYFKSRGRFE